MSRVSGVVTFTYILQGYFTGTEQSYDCPKAGEAILKDINKQIFWIKREIKTEPKQNIAKLWV